MPTIATHRRCLILASLTLFLFAQSEVTAQPDGAVHEFLSREEALLEVFPSSRVYREDTIMLDDAGIQTAEKALFRKFDSREFEVILCYSDHGEFLGYAVISEELGKFRPITYIVGIDPTFHVRKVAVMVYREDRGGEVQTPRFLYQYRGKSVADPIRLNRDIINISGATISVRAINAGVKKVLYLVTDHFRANPPAARLSESDISDRVEQ